MYTLTVRDNVMIAHSFTGDIFGPAQKLHGATYVVDVSFERPELDDHDLVVDIGLASDVLGKVLAPVNMQNLDELPQFRGHNTTTEFMARYVFDGMAGAIRNGELGEGAKALTALKVTLSESHIAWASYRGEL
ncbi:6-carboxytetrahydropterin synthase [Marinobacter bryozoorum]|uniref:6-pyruvoyl trahydropterin synthase family protein n=1 Tax=Marinobacter bryozoorum TaxID=256324 RepID=UPI0020061EEB|nr:6-carboxytetrahydropterin synthase [Marinobacter bryozoorum]MCK7544151.1 6-carboxytetrahydropterin synthase [Marinobacter bryozoorum]